MEDQEPNQEAQECKSQGSQSLLLKKSFASFFDVDTDYDDPDFVHQPRALVSTILGDNYVPELFDVLVAEAEGRTLQRVEEIFWSWDPAHNMPAIILIIGHLFTKTVSRLVICDDGNVVCRQSSLDELAKSRLPGRAGARVSRPHAHLYSDLLGAVLCNLNGKGSK